MFGLRATVLGKGCAVALAALASGAVAATKPLDPVVLPDDLADLRITDLTVKDPLGFDCIQERHIDLAFHATAKGVRMPRTCLPEPCEKALTPYRLASLIGRNPTEGEWDQYIARYADFCRKEVVPFEAAPADADAPVDVLPGAAFWLPLLAGFGDGPTDRRGPTGGPVFAGGGGPGGGGPFVLGTGGGSDGDGGTPGGGGVLPDGVQPIPLPAPLWLLLAALFGLHRFRARGRSLPAH